MFSLAETKYLYMIKMQFEFLIFNGKNNVSSFPTWNENIPSHIIYPQGRNFIYRFTVERILIIEL